MMSIPVQELRPSVESTGDDLRIRRKTVRLLEEFGAQLLETPISDLRRMTELSFDAPSDQNLFARIWDRYRFVPTARLLRSMSGDPASGLTPYIRVLDEVWNDADERTAH